MISMAEDKVVAEKILTGAVEYLRRGRARYAYAYDPEGQPVAATDRRAVQWSVDGALAASYRDRENEVSRGATSPDQAREIVWAILIRLVSETTEWDWLTDWDNSSRTSLAEILSTMARATDVVRALSDEEAHALAWSRVRAAREFFANAP